MPLPLPVPQAKHGPLRLLTPRSPGLTSPRSPSVQKTVCIQYDPKLPVPPQACHPIRKRAALSVCVRVGAAASTGPRYNTYVAPGEACLDTNRSRVAGQSACPHLGSSVRVAATRGHAPCPTIRRVQSLRAPPSSMIRSVPISRTEVPQMSPPTAPTLYQYKPYQSSQARSDYPRHSAAALLRERLGALPVQPYTSSASSYYSDGALCDVDAYGTVQLPGPCTACRAATWPSSPRVQDKKCVAFAGVRRGRGQRGQLLPANDHSMVPCPRWPTRSTRAPRGIWRTWKYRLQSIRRRPCGRRPGACRVPV